VRVVATLTIDGTKETRIEGDSPFMGGVPGDTLEQKGLGVWVSNWRYVGEKGAHHKGRVFCPWTSVLFVEESGERG
jgi:hypothetical protein